MTMSPSGYEVEITKTATTTCRNVTWILTPAPGRTQKTSQTFKSNSPETCSQVSYGSIEPALNNVDNTLSNNRTYISDMIGWTKIGKSGLSEWRTS